MINNYNVWKNIERLGTKYYQDNLADWSNEKLENNWWESLKFFFEHSFMRGRRDELSLEYYYFTIEALKDYFKINPDELDKSYSNIKKQIKYFDYQYILKFKNDNKHLSKSIYMEKFKNEVLDRNPIIELLKTKKKIKLNGGSKNKWIHLGNDEDIMMVLDVLNFISSDNYKKNIYTYFEKQIIPSNVSEVYEELIKFRAIGDKIASFIIRDIILINDEINDFTNSDMERGFPIDTWVNKIAEKLDCSGENINETKINFITGCKEYKINTFKFAAGLWYLGFYSLDLILENCLKKIEI